MAQGVNLNNLKNKIGYFIIPVGVFLITFFILFSLERAQPLVHDEAVYLTKARSWQEGSPANEFKIYRPIGMAFFGRSFLQFNESEESIRIFGVFFGAFTVLLIYLLFKKIFDWAVGMSVAAITISSTLFLNNSPQFLNDIPSSGLLFGLLWVIWDCYKSAGRGKLIYLFAPFSALAFYLRYGVSSTLVILVVLSFFILGKKFIKKENVSYERIFDTSIFSIILFVPHFLESFFYTGSFLGILRRSGDAAGRKYLGEGLLDYVRWIPNEIAGWVMGVSAIIGIISLFIIIFKKSLREKHVGLFWIGTIGLLNFILTGLLVHAEARYVFFSMIIFTGVGVATIFLLFSKIKFFKFFILAIFLIFSSYFGYFNYGEVKQAIYNKSKGSRNSYVEASNIIKSNTLDDKECVIWSGSFRPELSWYSGCYTLTADSYEEFKRNFIINFRMTQYSVEFSKQDDNNKIDLYGVKLNEIFRTKASETLGDLIVYKIDEDSRIRFGTVEEVEPL